MSDTEACMHPQLALRRARIAEQRVRVEICNALDEFLGALSHLFDRLGCPEAELLRTKREAVLALAARLDMPAAQLLDASYRLMAEAQALCLSLAESAGKAAVGPISSDISECSRRH